jgi:plastocyanin
VNVATSVGGKGFRTFMVTLKRGTYTFQCDPHAFSMKGTFRVR